MSNITLHISLFFSLYVEHNIYTLGPSSLPIGQVTAAALTLVFTYAGPPSSIPFVQEAALVLVEPYGKKEQLCSKMTLIDATFDDYIAMSFSHQSSRTLQLPLYP